MELPQLEGDVFLTDAGIETDLIFHHGIELPLFASFPLHDDPQTVDLLRTYFVEFIELGARHNIGMVLETATWRASSDWGDQLGYDAASLYDVNRRAVDLLLELRDQRAGAPVVVSGCVGPRGDAYSDLGRMTAAAAAEYHVAQIAALASAGADIVGAYTLTNVAEAIGIVEAARSCAIPSVISFTVETDGVLPDGTRLADAIEAVDNATASEALYFLVNCAHPDHVEPALSDRSAALGRLRGVRANASRHSHAELDDSSELDDGDPAEFGAQLAALHRRLPHLTILGGCCGTDRRHIAEIAIAVKNDR